MASRVQKRTAVLVVLGALSALLLLLLWGRPGILGLEDRRDPGAADGSLDERASMFDGDRAELLETSPTLAGNVKDVPVARGPVDVTVISPLGHRLAGVAVRLERDAWNATGELDWATTDTSGRVAFSDVAYDGRAMVCVGTARLANPSSVRGLLALLDGAPPPGLGDRVSILTGFSDGLAITGPSLTYRLYVGVPLAVAVVRADDGLRAAAESLAFPCFVGSYGKPVAIGRLLAVGVGPQIHVELATSSPSGYVVFDHPPFKIAVPPGTARIVVRLPVRREAQIRVVFPDETPAGWHTTYRPTVLVAGMRVSGQVWIEFDAIGNARLMGVPFIDGVRVDVGGGFAASDDDPELATGAEGSVQLTNGPDAEHVLRLSFVEDLITDHFETDNDLPFTEPLPLLFSAADAGLIVHVTGPSGQAVRGARVSFQHVRGGALVAGLADAEGTVRFEGLHPGVGRLSVWGAGAPSVLEEVVLLRGETTEVDLRGVRGGDLQLSVTDAGGHPVSFARFHVFQPSGLPWCDLDPDGVLRADRFVDADGTRLLHALEPGSVKLRVWYGNRHAETTVVVENGRTHDVALKLR